MAVPNQELSLEQEQDNARHDPDTGQETGQERRKAAEGKQEKPETLQEVVDQIKSLSVKMLSAEGEHVGSYVEAIGRLLDGVPEQFRDRILAEVEQADDKLKLVEQPAQQLQEKISVLETLHKRLTDEIPQEQEEGTVNSDEKSPELNAAIQKAYYEANNIATLTKIQPRFEHMRTASVEEWNKVTELLKKVRLEFRKNMNKTRERQITTDEDLRSIQSEEQGHVKQVQMLLEQNGLFYANVNERTLIHEMPTAPLTAETMPAEKMNGVTEDIPTQIMAKAGDEKVQADLPTKQVEAIEVNEGGYGDDDDLTQAKPAEITDEVTHTTGAEAFTPDMVADVLIRKIIRLIDTGQNPAINRVDSYMRDQGGTLKPNVTARLDTHGNLIIGERQINGISKESRITIPVEEWHNLMRHPELAEHREQIERTLAEHTIEYVPNVAAVATTAANMAPANMAPANMAPANEKTAGPVVRMAA